MRAIEIKSKTDKTGHLKISYQLEKSNRNVRVLILLDDDNKTDEEKLWMDSISKSPSFDFLHDKSEDIYSLKDGEPFND
ncbi:MAG: hypothetical protein GXO89_12825 [Chlorobi bacterium]|nr:hypothetical protein [Chlorobiota bacterium]